MDTCYRLLLPLGLTESLPVGMKLQATCTGTFSMDVPKMALVIWFLGASLAKFSPDLCVMFSLRIGVHAGRNQMC
eukprot:5443372-Prorocentrum_lima.AAC.1